MTFNELNSRFGIMERFFKQDKWKDKEGEYRYPKGKKAYDAIQECLSIIFDENEILPITEFSVKENQYGLSGYGIFCKAITEGTIWYCSFFLSEKLFIANILDVKYIAIFESLFSKKTESDSEECIETPVEKTESEDEEVDTSDLMEEEKEEGYKEDILPMNLPEDDIEEDDVDFFATEDSGSLPFI